MNILFLNGPNLNLLGCRDVSYYGSHTIDDVYKDVRTAATKLGVSVDFFQSSQEGALIDYIHDKMGSCSGIIINAGALTHYGLSLKDAVLEAKVPIVEVHISNIHSREKYRRHSVIEGVAVGQIAGLGWKGYSYGLELLVNYVRDG